MLSFALALILAVWIPILHLSILRITRRIDRTVPLAALICALACVTLFSLLRSSGFFPVSPELVSAVAFLATLCLGYMELMFKLYRGFSYTILTDIDRLGSVSLVDLMDHFAEDLTALRMLAWRLSTMEGSGLLSLRKDRFCTTTKGRFGARVATLYQWLVCIKNSG